VVCVRDKVRGARHHRGCSLPGVAVLCLRSSAPPAPETFAPSCGRAPLSQLFFDKGGSVFISTSFFCPRLLGRRMRRVHTLQPHLHVIRMLVYTRCRCRRFYKSSNRNTSDANRRLTFARAMNMSRSASCAHMGHLSLPAMGDRFFAIRRLRMRPLFVLACWGEGVFAISVCILYWSKEKWTVGGYRSDAVEPMRQ